MANDTSSAVTTFIAFIDSKFSKDQSITSKQIHDWRHNHQKASSKAKTSVIESAIGREISLHNLPHILKVCYHSFPTTQVLINNLIKHIDSTKTPELGLQQGSTFREKIKNIPFKKKCTRNSKTLNSSLHNIKI